MKVILSFLVLSSIKIFTKIFYRFEVKWLSTIKEDWSDIRIIIFLNHTSLYEPLYVGILPFRFIWTLAHKLVAPGADKTLNRPVVGFFWKVMGPGIMSISRKRDKTWVTFMRTIQSNSVIVIAPEGRMKRSHGLDLQNNPMTVRSGVADILEHLHDGRMLLAYSGGLHHIQTPGQRLPRLFKTIKMNIEILNISEYKSQFSTDGIQWKKEVVADLQHRLENNCPQADNTPFIKASEH